MTDRSFNDSHFADEGEDLPEAIPAATLVVFRDVADGPPELLMVERAKAMVFAAGAMVFPGGRVDPGDHLLAQTMGGDEEMAARIGAVRETIEEAGLPVGLATPPSAKTLDAMRAALHAGTPFGEVLKEAGAALDLDLLVPFARWRPAHRNMRIFDTRFYLARLPADAPRATVDQTENVRLVWASAQKVLDEADAGRMAIIFPTRRNLERLAQFASYEDAVAHARATPQRVVTPWPETRDGEQHLCIPDDLGYPVTSERLAAAMRG
ncbi:NUDIX hydrolase [Sphingomonas adhaesiva]|uniref:NUDIX hydrolase n=1 Tax=Sphingomonas adhaesiva TaxID=28212 RepID=UPI002FF9BC0D